MDSCGEYFFSFRLTDFILFLVLAWRNGSFVSEIFFCLLPGVLGFSSIRHEPCPTTDFLIIYFRWREGVPTSVFGSSQSFGFSLLPPWPGDPLGLLYVTPYPILFPSGHQVQTSVFPFWLGFVTLGLTHILSCLNGHSLMAYHC